MSLKVQITKEDVLRGKVLEMGWYKVTVKSIVEEVAASGNSVNYVCDFIVDSPESVAGTPIRHWFNSSDAGRARWPAFFNALGANINEKTLSKPIEVDFELALNRSLDIFVQPGKTKDGKDVNQILDFRRSK